MALGKQKGARGARKAGHSRTDVAISTWGEEMRGCRLWHRICGAQGRHASDGTMRLETLVVPRRWLKILILLFPFFLPARISAVMPPWVYEEARDKAMFHVQVKILKVTAPAQTPGECAVEGEVVQIFRDTPGTLKQGTVLTFTVSCSKPGDPVIVGGTLWTNLDSLMQAKYLEAFLNGSEHGYGVALWQSFIIAAPTAQPVIPSPRAKEASHE